MNFNKICILRHQYKILTRDEKQRILKERNMEDKKGIPLWLCRKCKHVIFSM